jgi:general nucleoside transport system permease protein
MSLRLQRRPLAPPATATAARIGAIVAALLIAGIVLAATGSAPLALGRRVIEQSFGSTFGLEDLGLLVTPLILTGLAVAVMQRIALWNIGAEGQFYAGAFGATAATLGWSGPSWLTLAVMTVAGIVGGMAWILIPTLARAYVGVSELITTLLLNFVAVLLVYYVSTGPWLDRATHQLAATPRIGAEVPEFWGNVHWGLPLAVLLAIVLAGLFTFTRWGYEVKISGANPGAALYAGIPMRGRIIAVMLLSGAIAGFAGALELAGTVHRLQGGISNNYGYLGIMVAVMARNSFLGVIAGATLMGVILNAGIILQTQGLNTNTVLAITGLILILTAIGDELAHYRLVSVETRPA